jgi:hypothetical protein
MLYNQSICLLLALCWCALHAQPDAQPSTPLTGDFREIGSARLVVHKHLLSQYAVQDKEVVVEYTLYNIGDKVCGAPACAPHAMCSRRRAYRSMIVIRLRHNTSPYSPERCTRVGHASMPVRM